MANPEHVEILKQGVKVWNRWRWKDNDPVPMPDISNVDLSGMNLSGADLSRADLSGTDLSRAELIDADLSDADLYLANLFMADLSRVDLARGDLSDVNLSKANLSGADLSYSKFGNTIIVGVDLRTVKNLETREHFGPSYIDLMTLYKSEGNIPESFLRGCGIPEDFIKYLSSLAGKPLEYYSCFISYSSKDQDFAERLYADFQNKGIRCWFAPKDMKIGERLRDKINQSVLLHDKLLVVLSKHSIESHRVEEEVEAAYEKERTQGKIVVFPIRLDDAVKHTNRAWAAHLKRSRHIGDFTNWKHHESYQKAFDQLLKDLKAEPE